MAVPAYYRSRQGRMFRVQRASQPGAGDGARFILRAFAVRPEAGNGKQPAAEVAREVDAESLRQKLRLGHAIPTPEGTFEQLWQELRLELEGL